MDLLQRLAEFVNWLVGNAFQTIISLIIGFFISELVTWAAIRRSRRRRNRSISEFFGLDHQRALPGPQVLIVHAAIFDESRGAYNYAASGIRAAQSVIGVLERAGLKTGNGYAVWSDRELLSKHSFLDPEIRDCNLVLLGGPERNQLTREVLDSLGRQYDFRYQIVVDPETKKDAIYQGQTRLISSRDRGEREEAGEIGYDYGLVMSTAHPRNPKRTVVILAGIHGTATMGAAMATADDTLRAELLHRRHYGSIQEVVIAKYQDGYDNVINTSIL